jgi:hypothetical protein
VCARVCVCKVLNSHRNSAYNAFVSAREVASDAVVNIYLSSH